MSLTLMLVGALCTSTGCDYLDASSKYELTSDAQCWEAAGAMNTLNKLARQDVRYSCVTWAELQRLRRAPDEPATKGGPPHDEALQGPASPRTLSHGAGPMGW